MQVNIFSLYFVIQYTVDIFFYCHLENVEMRYSEMKLYIGQ